MRKRPSAVESHERGTPRSVGSPCRAGIRTPRSGGLVQGIGMRQFLLSTLLAIGLGILPGPAIPPSSLGPATAAELAVGDGSREETGVALAEPPGVDAGTSATHPEPRPLLIVADPASARAAASLLDDAASAGRST